MASEEGDVTGDQRKQPSAAANAVGGLIGIVLFLALIGAFIAYVL